MKLRLQVFVCLLLVLCLPFAVSGCWGSREVENLSVYTITGMDWINEDGVDKWQTSVRVMRVQSGKQGGGQPSGKGSEEVLWKGTGSTFAESVANFNDRSPRKPFYAHVGVYVLGERLAKEKLGEFMEGIERYFEARPRLYLVVTKGEAFKVLQSGPEISPTISKEILEMVRKSAEQNGFSIDITASKFSALLLSPDREAVLPWIKVIHPQEKKGAEASGPDKSVEIAGLGVFRGTKLVGWLSREESFGSLLMVDNLKQGMVFLPVDLDERKFTYTIGQSKRKVKAGVVDGRLNVQVTIQTWGGVTDPNGLGVSTEEIGRLETAAGNRIRDIALMAVGKAKEFDSDFLGFTQQLHRTSAAAWREIEPHWRESFRDADVDIIVKAKIVNTGKIGKSLKFKQ